MTSDDGTADRPEPTADPLPTPPPAGADPGPPTRRGSSWWQALDRRHLRTFWLCAAGILGVQLVALVVYSGFIYHRFDLTDDFATYAQAWWLIGHGHVNPVDTIQIPNYPFWQSHFELAMWPIAWVGRIWPHSVQLLWLQDAAIVATQWIAVTWVASACAVRLPSHRSTVAVVALLVLAANPWWYLAASFDIHFELLGLPFVLWSAYALWNGKPRQAWIVALVALLFGDVVAVTVLCVGAAGLLSRRVRREIGWRTPAVIAAASAAWLVLIAVVGGNRGSAAVVNYGYLVGAHASASTSFVIEHLLLHPGHALRVLFDRRAAMGRVIASAGTLGVFTPWGFTVAVGTLGPATLNVNTLFLSPQIAFQTLAVIPFVFVGTVLILLRMAVGRRPQGSLVASSRTRIWATLGVAAVLVAVTLGQNLSLFGTIDGNWLRVEAPTAAQLRQLLPVVPADAEVIVSQAVIGRFADRTYVYPYLVSPQAFKISAPTVVFVVVSDPRLASASPTATTATLAQLRRLPGATVVSDADDVTAVLWHPPPGTTSLVLGQ